MLAPPPLFCTQKTTVHRSDLENFLVDILYYRNQSTEVLFAALYRGSFDKNHFPRSLMNLCAQFPSLPFFARFV